MTITRGTAILVDERDGGRCVICGAKSTNRHHRKPRRHGDDTPANMLALCGSGTTGCHGWVTCHPKDAYANGWSIRANNDPEEVPVLVRSNVGTRNMWALHNNQGERTIIATSDAYQRLHDAGLRTEQP